MIKRVEDFAYNMIVNVFNAENTAPLAVEAILDTGTFTISPKAQRIEDPQEWTPNLITKRAAKIDSDKGPAGDFDD
jgi:fructose-bisphosphate aldolase class II